MAAVRHLGYVLRKRETTRDVLFVVFVIVEKVKIGTVVLIISRFNDF